jgi:hypothetical protein
VRGLCNPDFAVLTLLAFSEACILTAMRLPGKHVRNTLDVGVVERGIVFNADMVRAIRAGRKTQTRRVLFPQPGIGKSTDLNMSRAFGCELSGWDMPSYEGPPDPGWLRHCPFGIPGDRLWVREKFVREGDREVRFRADRIESQDDGRWRNALQLRRCDARLVLEVTDVRVERLQAITAEDARAEGADWRDGANSGNRWSETHLHSDIRLAYRILWESLHGPDSWSVNPWAWVISFKRLVG